MFIMFPPKICRFGHLGHLSIVRNLWQIASTGWFVGSPIIDSNCNTYNYMGASRSGWYPKMGWFIRENPIKMDDLRDPFFRKAPYTF